ncbi:MAG: ATP-binding protein, partial [Anaerolineae bacterium]|nr:ATP-binding protein [Anaerolineae bacterium]
MGTQKTRQEPSQLVALLPGGDIEALAETMVAFANADGGTLYVGVAENGHPTGEVFPEEFNAVVHQAEYLCRPPIPVDWSQMEAGGAFIFAGRFQRSPELHALAD